MGLAANGVEARALLLREVPDIAFLDIRMPGLSGLDVARGAGTDIHIVFVTAFDQYAVDAFEREACDYLLKPVSDERLGETCARLKRRLADRDPAPGLATALAAIAQAVPALRSAGERLDPERFWQVHRGTVVNLAHVASTRRDLAGRVTVAFKSRAERIAVSRAYAHRFKQM